MLVSKHVLEHKLESNSSRQASFIRAFELKQKLSTASTEQTHKIPCYAALWDQMADDGR